MTVVLLDQRASPASRISERVVGEDADDVGAAADLAVEALERVRIPYETARMPPVTPDRLDVLDVRVGEYGATVRDRGIREQTRSGRPVLFDGLRARVSRWPPLRLARMRCERGSVGVVCPPVSLHVQRAGGETRPLCARDEEHDARCAARYCNARNKAVRPFHVRLHLRSSAPSAIDAYAGGCARRRATATPRVNSVRISRMHPARPTRSHRSGRGTP